MNRFAVQVGSQSFSLAPGVYRIGRAPTCDIRLDDQSVSRTHATLRVDKSKVMLEESGSRNGVSVNGERKRGAIELSPGDRIQVGSVEIRLVTLSVFPTHEDVTRPLPRIAPPQEASALSLLSERERDVLARIARGQTQREIAEALGLSIKTVETYRSRIAEKLDLFSRSEMVAFAIENGLLSSSKLPQVGDASDRPKPSSSPGGRHRNGTHES